MLTKVDILRCVQENQCIHWDPILTAVHDDTDTSI